MTAKEFSDGFDTLLNSYARSAGFGNTGAIQDINLNEYEKSYFLTQAQEQLVLAYYTGKNSTLDSFEKTEEIRRYLSNLVETVEQDPETDDSIKLLDSNSKIFSLPDDLWFITYESVKLATDSSDPCSSGKEIQVVPVTQDEFHRISRNPFRRPSLRRALRLDLNDNKVEIVSSYNIAKYKVRYIRQLDPIVVSDLDDSTTVENYNVENGCTLHSALHRPILELAVRLALQSKGIQIQNKN